MKVISVLGRKGGSGKSQISHLISTGLGRMGHPVVMYQTDVRSKRPPDLLDRRPYFMHSVEGNPATDADHFEFVYKQTQKIRDSILVIDGGANRRTVDHAAVSVSDLVLVPLGYSPEDIEVAVDDYNDLRDRAAERGRTAPIFFVLNRWPGERRKHEMVVGRPWVANFLREHGDQRFPLTVTDMPSMQDLAYHENPVFANLQVLRVATEMADIFSQALDLPMPGGDEAPALIAAE